MWLWIDDLREPPDTRCWTWAKTADEALLILRSGTVEFISFDYDLGNSTAYPVAVEIEYRAVRGIQPPGWNIHSQNPQGAARLRAALYSAEQRWKDCVRKTG